MHTWRNIKYSLCQCDIIVMWQSQGVSDVTHVTWPHHRHCLGDSYQYIVHCTVLHCTTPHLTQIFIVHHCTWVIHPSLPMSNSVPVVWDSNCHWSCGLYSGHQQDQCTRAGAWQNYDVILLRPGQSSNPATIFSFRQMHFCGDDGSRENSIFLFLYNHNTHKHCHSFHLIISKY